MQSKRSSLIHGLGAVAVGAGALGVLPAPASATEIIFSPNLRERVLDIETTAIGPDEIGQPKQPSVPFNDFVFIRVVVPYNKFVPPKPPKPTEASAPVSAVEAFESVRRR